MSDDFDNTSSDSQPNGNPVALLIVYVLFVVATLLVSIAIFAMPRFTDEFMPYFGSPMIGPFYAGTLIFVVMKFVARETYPNEKFRSAIGSLLVIIAVFGVFTTGLSWIGGNFDNPYLTVNAFQPIWTVGVPLAWYLVFRTLT